MERISAGIRVFGNSSPTWKSFNHVSKSAVTRWETEAPPWTAGPAWSRSETRPSISDAQTLSN